MLELEGEVERLKAELQRQEIAKSRHAAEELQRTTTIESVINTLQSLNGGQAVPISASIQHSSTVDASSDPIQPSSTADASSTPATAGGDASQEPNSTQIESSFLEDLSTNDWNGEGWVTLPMDRNVLDVSNCESIFTNTTHTLTPKQSLWTSIPSPSFQQHPQLFLPIKSFQPTTHLTPQYPHHQMHL